MLCDWPYLLEVAVVNSLSSSFFPETIAAYDALFSLVNRDGS